MNILAVGAHPDNFKPHGAGTPAHPRGRLSMILRREQMGGIHPLNKNASNRQHRPDFGRLAGVTR